MRGLLASLMIKLGLDSSQFKRGMNEAEQKTNKFGNFMKKIGGMIAGAFAVQQIISFGKELVNLGGIAEGVRAAFERIADDKVLQDLKDATHGTVSELELMKRTVQASNFGLPVEKLAGLFEFATKRAQETGESVDYLVNSIVLGISRKSIPILDNLGISATQLREKLGAAGVAGATSFELMTAVNEIASDSMRESGGVIDTNATKVQKLKSEWDNFKKSLAEDPKFNESIGNFLDGLNREIKLLPSGLDTAKKSVTNFYKFFGNIAGGLFKPLGFVLDYKKAIDKAEESVRKQEESQKKANETLKKASEIVWSLSGNLGIFQKKQESIQLTFEEWEKNNEKISKQNSLLELINETHQDINKILKQNIEDANKFFSAGISTEGIGDEFSNMFGSGMFGDEKELDTSNYEKLAKNYRESQDKILNDFNAFKQDMAMAVADFSINVVSELGAAFGQLAVTGKFPADFGKNVLSIIGGFISELGKMLIGLGIAAEAFQNLLKSAFTNPVSAGLAIAAGIGLVLLGGAIQGAVKAGPTGSSSGSVSTSSYSNASGYGNSSERRDSKVVFELDGTKLRGVLNNVDRKYGLIG